MEIDKDFKIKINNEHIDFPKYFNVENSEICIIDAMPYVDSKLLMQFIRSIQNFGFRICVDRICQSEIEFLIYWKSYKITYFCWNQYTVYSTFWVSLMKDDFYLEDLVGRIMDLFHGRAVIFVLLMARVNRNVTECYIGKLPSDLIKYIYEYIFECVRRL